MPHTAKLTRPVDASVLKPTSDDRLQGSKVRARFIGVSRHVHRTRTPLITLRAELESNTGYDCGCKVLKYSRPGYGLDRRLIKKRYHINQLKPDNT